MFGGIKLSKNTTGFGKYKYSRYDIGFDARGSFSLSDDSEFGKNVVKIGADMSSSVHVDNRKKIS